MAVLDSGILSTPRGKLSTAMWIHPRTGKVYSPPPHHRDARTAEQLEHRRRMALVGPLLRGIYPIVVRPFWGKMKKPLTGYNMALGYTLRHYAEYRGVPYLSPLGVAAQSDIICSVRGSTVTHACWLEWWPEGLSGLPVGTALGVWVVSSPACAAWWSGWLSVAGLVRTDLPLWYTDSWSGANYLAIVGFQTDLAGLLLLRYWRADYYGLGPVAPA